MMPKHKTQWLLSAALAASALTAGATTPYPQPILHNQSAYLYLSSVGNAPRAGLIEASRDFHLTNEAEEPLPATAELNGATVPLHWERKRSLDRSDARHAALVYECQGPHLRLTWEWEARAAAGPFEHRVTIENLGAEELWLPLVDSLRLDLAAPASRELRSLYVEKGADSPSPEGTHIDTVADGYAWTGYSSTYAVPWKGQPREIIPAVVVYRPDADQRGWYAGIEFSGRTRIALARSGNRLHATLGLNPDPGPFRTRLAPGESFVTPTVFLGLFTGGPDGAGNQLRPWVRAVLGNPLTWADPHYPFLVNNSWGSGMQVDEPLALRMIAESRELGLEMFHIDAGWFRAVGDWQPDPRKFPHGLAYIADAAHAAGLRFGIWTDWTQAALSTAPGALNARDPKVADWLITDLKPDWKPEEFKGQTIDIGVPEAELWAAGALKHIVEDFKLDMLEHDGYLVAQGCVRAGHPHAAPDPGTLRITHDWASDFVLASNSTDVSYRAVRAYYRLYEQLRREHPGLLFEICNDGGRMVDFGSAAHGDYFSITDTYDPLSNRRAFFDTSHLLPAAMLESYVERWPAPRIENFRYMLRSGMMGWVSIMLDTIQWTPEQHAAARAEIALYKEKLRPLIRDAQLFHVSPRPDGVHWDGIEYWDPARGHGVVYAFRGSTPDELAHRFVLAGLSAAKRYRLHFQDGTAPDRVETGSALMNQGLEVRLDRPFSSELVLLEDAPAIEPAKEGR
ncbi:MAG: alpha-galactosidase [Terracidiphilus sp.]